MLKINADNSVCVVLTGDSQADFAFLFVCVLVGLALGVAYLAMTMPVPVAIGGLGVLAVACFCFNHYKAKLKNHLIMGTTLTAKPFELSFNNQRLILNDNALIEIDDDLLIIMHNNHTYQFAGFDNSKEVQVVKAVLQGQTVGKKFANIKMGN